MTWRPKTPNVAVLTQWISLTIMTGAILLVSNPTAAKNLTDLLGRTITLPDKVERIVALGPGSLRLVVYLGATNRLVGIEAVERRMERWLRPYSLAIGKQVRQLPIVSQGGPGVCPDPERLMAIRPDVILTTSIEAKHLVLLQRRLRLPVVALSYGEQNALGPKLLKSIELLGEILGRQARAESIVEKTRELEQDLSTRVAKIKDVRNAYVGGIGFKGSHGIESTETGFLPFELVNAKNVAEGTGTSRHVMIEIERLLVWNPDFIFMDIAGFQRIGSDYRKRPGFYNALDAVSKGRIYTLLPYNHYNTNIEIVYSNAYAVGKVLYPDCFMDIDLNKNTRKIVEFFIGKPIDDYISQKLSYRKVVVENELLQIR